ncbi:MAG TPA: hypothetical protein VNZ06_08390 [Steroidobacteraceae bacterium]|jgi:hypothetical protein|nr:hypothetical protein [Steroidobacteraceae bacterium]
MKPQTPNPPPLRENDPPPGKAQKEADQALDRELDRELDDTFPASDPLPWSHEVK